MDPWRIKWTTDLGLIKLMGGGFHLIPGEDALTLFGWLMPVYGGYRLEEVLKAPQPQQHHRFPPWRTVPSFEFSFRTSVSDREYTDFGSVCMVLVGIRKHISVFFLLPISNKSESMVDYRSDYLTGTILVALRRQQRGMDALSLARYLHYLSNHCSLDCWCKITLALKRFRVLIYLCQWEITSALHQQAMSIVGQYVTEIGSMA